MKSYLDTKTHRKICCADDYNGLPPEWLVKDVIPQDDYTLLITFVNDSQKTFDIKPYLTQKPFIQLRDKELFFKAHSNGTTVVWNSDIDIAPETLYKNSY